MKCNKFARTIYLCYKCEKKLDQGWFTVAKREKKSHVSTVITHTESEMAMKSNGVYI